MTNILIKRGKLDRDVHDDTDTFTHVYVHACHVNRKVETGTIHPEAKKCQGQLAILQKL